MIVTKSFLYEERDGVGWITLNRPERLNALTFEVYRELTDTFAALRDEAEVRAVELLDEVLAHDALRFVPPDLPGDEEQPRPRRRHQPVRVPARSPERRGVDDFERHKTILDFGF